VPTAVQEGAFQRFDSIEDVKTRLRIGTIYLPAFYPQSVRWPPALIGAQTTPYAAVMMEYRGRDQQTIYLVTTQTARPNPPLQERLRLVEVREKVRYPFKGRTAVLEVGVCRDSEQCCRMSWEEGDYLITLVLRSSPMELVRIAESMIPAQQDKPAER
jgi:hypothetical protein